MTLTQSRKRIIFYLIPLFLIAGMIFHLNKVAESQILSTCLKAYAVYDCERCEHTEGDYVQFLEDDGVNITTLANVPLRWVPGGKWYAWVECPHTTEGYKYKAVFHIANYQECLMATGPGWQKLGGIALKWKTTCSGSGT